MQVMWILSILFEVEVAGYRGTSRAGTLQTGALERLGYSEEQTLKMVNQSLVFFQPGQLNLISAALFSE